MGLRNSNENLSTLQYKKIQPEGKIQSYDSNEENSYKKKHDADKWLDKELYGTSENISNKGETLTDSEISQNFKGDLMQLSGNCFLVAALYSFMQTNNWEVIVRDNIQVKRDSNGYITTYIVRLPFYSDPGKKFIIDQTEISADGSITILGPDGIHAIIQSYCCFITGKQRASLENIQGGKNHEALSNLLGIDVLKNQYKIDKDSMGLDHYPISWAKQESKESMSSDKVKQKYISFFSGLDFSAVVILAGVNATGTPGDYKNIGDDESANHAISIVGFENPNLKIRDPNDTQITYTMSMNDFIQKVQHIDICQPGLQRSQQSNTPLYPQEVVVHEDDIGGQVTLEIEGQDNENAGLQTKRGKIHFKKMTDRQIDISSYSTKSYLQINNTGDLTITSIHNSKTVQFFIKAYSTTLTSFSSIDVSQMKEFARLGNFINHQISEVFSIEGEIDSQDNKKLPYYINALGNLKFEKVGMQAFGLSIVSKDVMNNKYGVSENNVHKLVATLNEQYRKYNQ